MTIIIKYENGDNVIIMKKTKNSLGVLIKKHSNTYKYQWKSSQPTPVIWFNKKKKKKKTVD